MLNFSGSGKDVEFSVVLATYNGEKHLLEQLKSINDQSCSPKELIVVDDGSSDNTIDLVETFLWKESIDVRVYRNDENIGFRRNFIKGASLANCDWICFSDQDDVWCSRKLETIAGYIEKYGENFDLFFHDFQLLGESGNHAPNPRNEVLHMAGEFDIWRTIPGMAICFSKRLKKYFGYQSNLIDLTDSDSLISHDQLVVQFANMKAGIVELKESLIQYRRHDATTSQFMKSRRKRSLKGLDYGLLIRKSIFCEKFLLCIGSSSDLKVSQYREFESKFRSYRVLCFDSGVGGAVLDFLANCFSGSYFYFGTKELFKDLANIMFLRITPKSDR